MGESMNLYDSLYLRKSVRSYRMEAVEDEILHYLEKFMAHLEPLDEKQSVHFDLVSNVDGNLGGKGPMLVTAPYYLVISAKQAANYLLNVGFMAEQVMLYLLTKGLATCFLKYRHLPVSFSEGYEPVLLLAFGRSDKILYREAKKARRHPMKEIAVWKTPVSDDMRLIVNAGRLAPSSWNSQPWRFLVYENRIHLFCRKDPFSVSAGKKLHRVDVGLALANLYIAAEELWYQSEMEVSDHIADRAFRKKEYLITLRLSK